jgi:hypothetical protein
MNAAKGLARSAWGLARSRLDEAFIELVKKRTGLLPIAETQPQDVFLCGYPKSGNTWFQQMTCAVIYGADVELSPDALINDLVPDVHFRKFYRRYGERSFFKSHDLPHPAYRNVVYLLRDGRDAMVSFYHHLSAMSGTVDFNDMVRSGRGLPSKWHDHVNAYLANPHGARMIVIRYEDLKRDTLAQLRRFCEFVGIERSDAALTNAIAKTTFERMRLKEQKTGWETPGWPKDKPFIRRGVVGSFVDEMPADVLEAFMVDARATLTATGYLEERDPAGAKPRP